MKKQTKLNKIKAVKAWAVVDRESNQLAHYLDNSSGEITLWQKKKNLGDYNGDSYKLIQVSITPIKKK